MLPLPGRAGRLRPPGSGAPRLRRRQRSRLLGTWTRSRHWSRLPAWLSPSLAARRPRREPREGKQSQKRRWNFLLIGEQPRFRLLLPLRSLPAKPSPNWLISIGRPEQAGMALRMRIGCAPSANCGNEGPSPVSAGILSPVQFLLPAYQKFICISAEPPAAFLESGHRGRQQ